MSESENHHHGRNEVIIVKRHGGGDHEGGHGGAWKIAYADFMTAMMAFFLVMWLVNAANEETKASVASYFNPIKLSDEKPTQKGFKKPSTTRTVRKSRTNRRKSRTSPTRVRLLQVVTINLVLGRQDELLRSQLLRKSLFCSCRDSTGSRPAGKCQRQRRGWRKRFRPCNRGRWRPGLPRSVRSGFLDEAG